jgi:hypothetical protein
VDERLRATERVATVSSSKVDVAFPFSVLEEEPVFHFDLSGHAIVVFFKKGTASALDAHRVAGGKDVGSTAVYQPGAGRRALKVKAEGDVFVDHETGSTGTLLGVSIEGPLKGEKMEPVWCITTIYGLPGPVFKPDTILYRGAGTLGPLPRHTSHAP